ncbi:hypothetical protein ACFPRL_12060 [Pseudoclavibacter helvolus]
MMPAATAAPPAVSSAPPSVKSFWTSTISSARLMSPVCRRRPGWARRAHYTRSRPHPQDPASRIPIPPSAHQLARDAPHV